MNLVPGDFVKIDNWKEVLFKLIHDEGGCWLAEVHDLNKNLLKDSGHSARSFDFHAHGVQYIDHNAYYHIDSERIISIIKREPVTYEDFIGE